MKILLQSFTVVLALSILDLAAPSAFAFLMAAECPSTLQYIPSPVGSGSIANTFVEA